MPSKDWKAEYKRLLKDYAILERNYLKAIEFYRDGLIALKLLNRNEELNESEEDK